MGAILVELRTLPLNLARVPRSNYSEYHVSRWTVTSSSRRQNGYLAGEQGQMRKTAVVALGGNAITRVGQAGSYAEQEANTAVMATMVCSLWGAGWRVVLVHGNGPQVGNLAIQHDEAAGKVPALPLFCLNAMTEGQIGSLLTLALRRVGDERLPAVACLITHVVVSADDPAFDRPVKPIGPFFDAAQAEVLAVENGWTVAEDAGRGYRRVVASPQPLQFLEVDAIRTLIEADVVVIAAGGGGVPVVADSHGYRGINAVVDKDLSAQRLATSLGAQALVLVTAVEKVMLDFGTPREHPVSEMTDRDAQRYLEDGQFPDGSMGPKVRAAIQFIRAGGQTAVITTPDRAAASLDPNADPDTDSGTRVIASRSRLGTAS
jgi:carbamate kinase